MERRVLQKRQLIPPMFGMCVFLSMATDHQSMYGNIDIQNKHLSSEVRIMGFGNLTRSTIEGDVRVFGFLKSKNSEYLSSIYATGSDVSLSNDSVEGDVHVSNYVKRPKLILDRTTIKGKVIFHGRKKGVVVMDKESVITQGIENGEVK